MITKLRKIPSNPVVFSYNSNNDSLPTVIVLSLLHDEENPGIGGINLNYVAPENRRKVLETFYMHKEDTAMAYENVKHLVQGAYRRYNYDKIAFFIYRGNVQDHNLVLTQVMYN